MNLLWPAENVYPVREHEKHYISLSQARLRAMALMQRMCNECVHYYSSSTWRHRSGLGRWCAIQTLSKRHLLPARAYSLIRREKQTKIQGYRQTQCMCESLVIFHSQWLQTWVRKCCKCSLSPRIPQVNVKLQRALLLKHHSTTAQVLRGG